MKHLFISVILLNLLSCGKNGPQTTGGLSHQELLQMSEQVILTELPESHFLPFKLNEAYISVNNGDDRKTYYANNHRNKVLSYYKNINQKLNTGLEIDELEWVRFPLLNVKDKQRLIDSDIINPIKITSPLDAKKMIKHISYSIRILDADNNLVRLLTFIEQREISFNIENDEFEKIFLSEQWSLQIAVHEAIYKNGGLRWEQQKNKRQSESFLDFTLNPLSVFYTKSKNTQFIATESQSLFKERYDLFEPLKEASITINLPIILQMPEIKNFNLTSGEEKTLGNINTNHVQLAIGFKQKNYRLKNNKKNAFIRYQEYSCTMVRGEPKNCGLKELRGSCNIEWTSLEETTISEPLTVQELEQLSNSLFVNDKIFYKNNEHSFISTKRQKIFQELKYNERIESLKIKHINLDNSYKRTLTINKDNCIYANKPGLKFIESDSWLNNHEKEVSLREITPIIEFSELYR